MTDEEALAHNVYACCEHCEHFDPEAVDEHEEPCWCQEGPYADGDDDDA